MRFFNTAGPVNPHDHYTLPPLSRIDLEGVINLIYQKKYFILHAPRQTGKTSCLLALRDHLNHEGHFLSLYINVEAGQTSRDDVKRGIQAVITQIATRAHDTFGDPFFMDKTRTAIADYGEDVALETLLTLWCKTQKNH